MAHQSESACLRALFEPALQVYEKRTGVSLTQHPLAIKLQSCDSVEAITGVLQDQAQAFRDFQGSDKIMKSLETTVSNLSKFSFAAPLADALGPTFPPAKAIQACLAILLDSTKGIISNCDALVDLLESIEHFLNRLSIYTRIPSTPAMDEIVVKILVELISTLALVTGELKQRRSIKYVKRFFKEKDIEAVLDRLDRLTQDEVRTTAAHTLAIVHGLVQNMREFMDDGKASIDGVREDLKILHQMASDMNKSRRDKLLSKIQRWLAPPDPWKNYNIGRESRHRETGAWFIHSSTLSEWKASGPSSLLWIHGKPGAGKSVLCSTIIEEIENTQKSGLASLAMFYYDFREEEKKDLRGLLSSVLFQLCNQSYSYYTILSAFYSTYQDGARSPSNDELIRCLKGLLNLPGQPPVYLVVDALDECPNTSLPSHRDQVLGLLEDLVDSKLPNLRICVTSRPETDIKPILEPLTFRSVSLHDESGQKEDIENYINSIVNTDRRMRRWTSVHKQLVVDVLTERADGMFRWVHCQLEYLARCLPGRIQYALDELPSTLDATYERTLQEIDGTNWEFARRLLHCVAAVFRPLRVEELAEFLAFDFNAGQIPKYRKDWRLEDPVDAVLSTCSTLFALVNTQGSQVVQFSHFSVKEFLTSTRFSEKCNTISSRYHISMTPAHALVAKACLGILLHLDKDITMGSLPKFPLAKYAAEHWFEHARVEGVSQNAEEGMSQMFDLRKPHLAVWLRIYDPTTLLFWNESTNALSTPHGTPLHYAGFCGLYDVVKVLASDHPQDMNSQSFIDGETPLLLTSRVGHIDVAQLLIEHGADVAAQNKNGTTPLHYASLQGHVDMARLLINHGADVAAQDKHGTAPLHHASLEGHVDMARLLIDHGADVAAQSKHGTTPLHHASLQGHVDMTRLLIEHSADVAAQNKHGTTPLHYASIRGHVDVARLLIEQGADAAAQCRDGWTPLYGPSMWGYMDVARLLIEHGANAAAQNKDGWAPLHQASERGHVDVAQLLIKHGADAVAKSKHGRTPLHQASSGGHVDVARLLVEHGADAAAKSEDGWTPLHEASERGHVDMAQLLIEHGANAAAPMPQI